MNGFLLTTFLFFVLMAVFGASSAAITNTNATNDIVIETHPTIFNVFSSSAAAAAAGNDIIPWLVEGYNIAHRPVVVVKAFSHPLLITTMKGLERRTRPGPFEGNAFFFNVKPARPGPLNVNDLFTIFYNKINNNDFMNSFRTTLEPDVAPGMARGFTTQAEVETSRRTSSSVKVHLQALGEFLHSALPSRPSLPSSWPSLPSSWPSLPWEGATTVPRWVLKFVAQLVGNGLLYAAYLWAMKDSFPKPLALAPARHHYRPLAATITAPAPAHRRVVTPARTPAVFHFEAPTVLPMPQPPAGATTPAVFHFEPPTVMPQPPAGATAPAVFHFEPPTVVPQPPAGATTPAVFHFGTPTVVPVPQPPAGATTPAVFHFGTPTVVPVPQPPAPAALRFQVPVPVPVPVPKPSTTRDWAAEIDAGIRAQLAMEAEVAEMIYEPEPEVPYGMDMGIWISMRRLQEERRLAQDMNDFYRWWGNTTTNTN